MTKTFLHSFAPSPASPITGAAVDLDVADIEVAGIREVCQGPEQEQSEIDGMEGSRSPGARMASCVEGSRVEGKWLCYSAHLECSRVSGL
ncbi:hypothetical protein At1D1460_47670 (plasmid) [Agrobacterium tumefaciens]|nr:hypothetical protein At1D1460_47670 [Agrobacterium tumefaciens]